MAEYRMNAPHGWRGLPDNELEQLVADDLHDWLDLGACDPTNLFKSQEPTPGQLALYATSEFQQALWNEGVHSALYNDDGVVLPAAMEGYRLF